jgi:hypothetical protein
MYKTNAVDFEQKIRRITRVEDPDDGFVTALWTKMENNYIPVTPKNRFGFWRRHPAWVVAAVILVLIAAVFIGFGPRRVSAFIRQIFGYSDSGLQAVQEAGLVTDLDISSQPTVVNMATPVEPLEVYPLNLSQTLADVTLTLDWAYIDEGRVILAFTMAPLPEGLNFDIPTLTFNDFTPSPPDGAMQSLTVGIDQLQFTSYQVIQTDVVGETVDFSVDLPLIKVGDPDFEPVALFHFDLQAIPVYRGQTLPLTQTAAVSLDNVEVRLKSVRMMPSFTEVTVCYDFPTEDAPFWYLQNATLQIGDETEVGYHTYRYLSQIEDDHCAVLGFDAGSATGASRAIFRVNKLVVPLVVEGALPAERIEAANEALAEYGIEIAPAPADQSGEPGGWVFVGDPPYTMDPAEDPHTLVRLALEESMSGPWTFYIDLPDPADINQNEIEAPEPTPIPTTVGSQTQSDVTVTLDWVFVDALRASAGYTITGLPDEPEALDLLGLIYFQDAQGEFLGGAGIGSSSIVRVEDQPGVLQGVYSVGFEKPLSQTEADLQFTITLDGAQANDIIASFPVAPDAEAYPPGVTLPRLPDGYIGTYQFEFTAPVHPMTVLEDIPSVTANGIEMLVPRAEITPSMSKVMLCFQKPSERDWWIMDAVMDNGTEGVHWVSGGPLYDRDYPYFYENQHAPDKADWEVPPDFMNVEHGRCIILNFLVGRVDPAEDLTLTISQLEISPPEVYPEEELAAAKEILEQQGIEMVYESWQSGGGGGSGVTFTSLPEGMTWKTAHQKFMEALGYVHAGPWEITLNGSQP